MYRFQFDDAVLEIEGNSGTVSLYASSPQAALASARRIFRHMRDVSVAGTADRYFVEFKVDLRYNRSLLRTARRLAKLDLTRENYNQLETHEKYMALLHAQLTGKETFIPDPMFLRGSLLALKNALNRQGGVANPNACMDFDIAVHNAVESRS